jgi:L-ascorbate metabolism protein UlaG (beta-lactamase superfamily)
MKYRRIFFGCLLFTLIVLLLPSTSISMLNQKTEGKVEVKWLGHACFYIKSSEGIRIVTDPFNAKMAKDITFPTIKSRKGIIADIITVSHEHADHNAVEEVNQVEGGAVIIRGVGETEAKGIKFKGVASFHDKESGAKRGKNTIIVFTVDGITFCHLGDLGHLLNDKYLQQIGKVDVIFCPVGGGPTIDAKEATLVAEMLKAKIAFPMHYRHKRAKIEWLAPVDEFLQGKENVKKLKSDTVYLSQKQLPEKLQIIVLDYE